MVMYMTEKELANTDDNGNVICTHPKTSVDMDAKGAPEVCDICGREV